MPESQDRPVLCYINQIRWPSAIPAAPFSAAYVTAMANAGIEVHFIVRSAAKGFDGKHGDGQAVLQNEFGITPPDNLFIHVINTPFWKPASDRIIFFERVSLLLKKLHREYGVNIVMSRDTRALPYLAKWRKKGFITVHDTHNFYADLSIRDDVTAKKAFRNSKFELNFIPAINGVLTLLKVQSDLYKKYFPNIHIDSALPGLSHTLKPDYKRFNKKVIGYVGTLSEIKGVNEILEAFKQLENKNIKLLLIGGRSDDEVRKTRDKLSRMELSDRVEITGWLNLNEMRKRLEEVSVAILPLKNNFYNRYLTAPSKLFDYLSYSIPVITTDLPAVREIAEDAAYYIIDNDVESLKTSMTELLNDFDKYKSLADAAFRRSDELKWDKRGQKTLKFFQELMKKS